MIDLEETLKKIETFVIKAGDFALSNWQDLHLINKDNRDLSTDIDLKIENEFYDFIKLNFPEHGFLGEENDLLKKELEYTWVIDPIDGTKNYIKQIPIWCVTVSLLYKSEPILGVIYNPTSKQLYSAIKGKGAFLNGKKLKIDNERKLIDSQVAIDIPIHPEKFKQESKKLTPLLTNLNISSYRVRNIGSGALSLAWLAQNMFVGYIDLFRPKDKLIDLYAGQLIATEAGAKIFKWKMKDQDERFASIVSTENIFEELKLILNEFI